MTTAKWKMTNGNCALARRRSALIVKLNRVTPTLATRETSAQQQVIKRQLGIIHSFRKFSVPNSGSRNVESFAHRIEMKADDSRCHANGRNASFSGQASYGRFAHLQNPRKLSCSKKLFTVVHGFRFGIILSQ